MLTDNIGALEAPNALVRQEDDAAGHAIVSDPDWWSLVRDIQNGSSGAMEVLYKIFSRGIRFYLCRHLGTQEVEDKVHDTFIIVVQAIQKGELREPERLMGFIRTIVRRQVAGHIEHLVSSRREQLDLDSGVVLPDRRRNPEERAIGNETEDLMVRVLRSMTDKDREILTRFYLKEESQEEICREMHLTETQFRLLKSRAKARFGELGKRKTKKKPIAKIFLRNFASTAHLLC